MRRLIMSFVLICVVEPGNSLLAQGREPLKQPTSVPIELATALAAQSFFSTAQPQILVGALPEWIAQRIYIPPGAQILGSAFLGSTVIGFMKVPRGSDSLRSELEHELQLRGWTAPAERF